MSTHVDGLTGLPTGAVLQGAVEKALIASPTVSVGVLDVDRFHELNKSLGHETGDELLRRLAKIMTAAIPQGVYRISGDEFACVLPGVTLEQAFLRMEALRAAVEAAGLPGEATVTIGVAQAPRNGKDAPALLQSADAALVSAKEAGRNQVGLPPSEDLIMKSCYYPSSSLKRLKTLAERSGRKESELLREALTDLLRKYDQ